MKKNKTNWEKVNLAAIGLGKIISWTLAIVVSVLVLAFIYVNLPVKASTDNAKIGVTFSYIYAEQIGLDWKQAYVAMLNDLKIKHIRLPIYWDRVEGKEGEYDFSHIDWQLEQARNTGAEIILVIGQKVPRWPECYVPKWVGEDPSNLPADRLKEKLLAFEEVVVNRYKDNHPEVVRWQVENEPFLNFGICSKVDTELLDSELVKVRALDPSRPIVVTDSGELSLWVNAAKRADVFGTTMYREVYSKEMGHWRYPIGPNFFKVKQLLIETFADQDNAIVIELQGEPWVAGWTIDAPVEVQLASMNAEILVDNVEFAKKTGMNEIYVWGVEWWYYMKTVQNNPTLWEVAKTFVQK
ncbi:MAG: Glycoside hydrolase family 35 [Parcubacteria group bacterium GW2011_GWD2_38_11]|nr:MAG: Glycoside hydrolase family 35 [Parcubacteria group bacterium GW2011_GWD2_38_11]